MKNLLTIFSVFVAFNLSAGICPDPPMNDDPCPTSSNPPMDLTGVNTHIGTTCCARGESDSNTDGTAADHPNYSCSALSAEAAVWYVFDANPDVEGYQVLLESAGNGMDAGASIAMEVYWATEESVCEGTLFEPAGASCAGLNKTVNISNCPGANQKLYVKVGTPTAGCGEFAITITGANCNTDDLITDRCVDAIEVVLPQTPMDFNIWYDCVQGCLDFACPESDTIGGCEQFALAPTVWLQVGTDAAAAQMFVTVETTQGDWTPVWSIYSGTSCDDLQVIDLGGTPACSDGDSTPELHQVGVSGNMQYWIAISYDPNSLPSTGLSDGSFEVCVATAVNAILCLGEDIGDCTDPSLIIEVVDREVQDGSLDGPFCQGEELTIHVSFFYDASESGNDWLHGLIPTFGSGWDLTGFDFASSAPVGNGIIAEWFEEGTAFAPIIQEPSPILCTYVNQDGRLELCNSLCSPCSECDQIGLQPGDALPSGYFWITAGGNAGCDNDGSPGESWGIGATQAQIEWEFTLRTKTFESLDACVENRDLFIGFQTFSDGVTGCWEDPVAECILDRAMFGPPWRIECSGLPPEVLAIGDTICSNDMIDIAVSTADGSVTLVNVIPVNNPLISGATSSTFVTGFGQLTDQLVNLSNVPQVQQYSAFSLDDQLVCTGLKNVISVLVNPVVQTDIIGDVCVCDGSGCTTFVLDQNDEATYAWSTGETASSITVCPNGVEQYSVTVSSPEDCDLISMATVDCSGTSPFCEAQPEFKIQYSFFIDDNSDGFKDSTEALFADGSFSILEIGDLIYNVTAAESDLYLDEGSYTIVYNSDHLPDWFLTTDSTLIVTLDSSNNCVKVAFGLSTAERIIDFRSYDNFLQRCNSDQTFVAYLKNTGTDEEKGIFWIELDELLIDDYFFDNNTLDTFILPNKIGFPFLDLAPGGVVITSLNVQVPGPPDFPVGGILNHQLYGEIDTGFSTDSIFGYRTLAKPVLCSYDPNDKMVTPEHPEGYTDITDSELTYKVRFQNTGNDVAYDIEIRDTLSEYLDISSVRFLSGSHDEFLTFTRSDDHVLTFRFDNINLPDSLSDPEGSQGYLIYNVDVLPDLAEGTLIENTAYIYFDNNPPIITNTTNNILYDDIDGDGYYSVEDCDDENAAINPDAEEIANNETDEDCDGIALVIDDDMDGFNSDEDCDDMDPAINPDAEEIINNDIDENCDGIAVVVDNDNDGFNSDDDCDDANADIYPGAPEIPGNGIDEDCDGEDEPPVATTETNPFGVSISPNPTRDRIIIHISESEDAIDYRIVDTKGAIMSAGPLAVTDGGQIEIDMTHLSPGLYMMLLTDVSGKQYSCHKVIRM